MQAAGGRRWRACPPRWRRWRLRCCCEVWQGLQAVGAVQVGQGWRWCVVIVCGGLLLAWSSGAALAVLILPGAGGGRNIHALCPALPGYFPAFPRGGCRQHPARAGLLIRQAGQAAEGGQKKKARAAARCALLLWPSVCTGGAICCAWCIPVHIVGGGVCSPFRCRAAGAGTDPGATVPAGNVPAWHGLRWLCSIRCVFAVCRRGQILHFTG